MALLFLPVYAQKATVERVEVTNNIAASKYPKLDLNGRTAALVIVQVLADNVEFKGSVLNDGVVKQTGEYWVYLGVGAKELHIHSDKFLPVEIRFPEYGIPRLEAAVTYAVTLSLPTAEAPVKRQKVEIRFSPANATVLIDGVLADVSGSTATATLDADRDYSYVVTARNYIPQQGSFHLHPAAPTQLNVNLSPDPSAAQSQQQAPQQPAPQPAAAPSAAPPFNTNGVTPVNLALCAEKADGSVAYITEDEWKRMASAEKSQYKAKGVCLVDGADAFIVEMRDSGGKMIWEDAVNFSLPTEAQAEIMSKNQKELNRLIKKFGGTGFKSGWYWTGAESGGDKAMAFAMIPVSGLGGALTMVAAVTSGTCAEQKKSAKNLVRIVLPVR